MPKSTEGTVFVRFVPTPNYKVLRHQLEDIFSQIGPIKKSSWINSKDNDSSKGYGFVKYLSTDDAENATSELNDTKIQMDGKEYRLKVELASLQSTKGKNTPAQATVKQEKKPTSESTTKNSPAPQGNQNNQKNKSESHSENTSSTLPQQQQQQQDQDFLKKKSRIILRNLSFYAKESHIRTALEKQFGKVVDIHVPKVQSNLHVGFCFVTFANPNDAQKAVDAKTVDIHKRSVTMDWSLPKKLHQQQKQQQKKEHNPTKEETRKEDEEEDDMEDDQNVSHNDDDMDNDQDMDENDDDEEEGEEEAEDDEDSNSDESATDEDDEEEEEEEMEGGGGEGKKGKPSNDSVKEKRTLFVRNIPFDATRNDLFELFAKFGYIDSIYLVKDKSTGMLKGTAFVTYKKPQSAQKAVDASSPQQQEETKRDDFVSLRKSSAIEKSNPTSKIESSIMLRGRPIIVNFAVDKETASTFDNKEYNAIAADRRNMYLQAVARVESTPTEAGADTTNTWEELPESDQKKRQSAFQDKTTKLKSPIFFINPNRLSFRNMAKHVDEAQLQKLCEIGTKRGLQAGLVTVKDYIAHLRAKGDMSTREILALVQDKEKSSDLIPPFEDTKNIKEYVPSVFIERDFGNNKKKADATSRGFGFAEFTHHVHALACLRELNNNPAYSREYVAGGKAADARKNKAKGADIRIPRLIVDFTVENKIKARQQAERRLHQQLNASKQRKVEDSEGETKKTENKKKRNRGAAQREKKRLERESGGGSTAKQQTDSDNNHLTPPLSTIKKAEPKKRKPPAKRRKVDAQEEKLQKLMEVHASNTETKADPSHSRKKPLKEKRWFE